MKTAFTMLKERGFVQQASHPEEIEKMFAEERVTAYVGIDPTADSLHVGHLFPVMVMAHLQQMGHRPIIVVGGGTAMVGDPSGKSEMRKMMSTEELESNKAGIRQQLGNFLDFSAGQALMVDNAEWLMNLQYIPFLREIGPHFSVNRMLTADCYRARMERPEGGLSFLEFNYMIMQAYDFLNLNRRYGCRLQIGGDDQWSNMLAGTDLIRRLEQKDAFVLTLPLLLNSAGQKMGKTVSGAVWLDAKKTSPYDFFQYWRNVDDADVTRLLKIYTFLSLAEINRLTAPEANINEAKKVLAKEVTTLVHGKTEADKAASAAAALFGGGGDESTMPTTFVSAETLAEGVPVLELLVSCGLAASKSEGRRLIQQGGLRLNDQKVEDVELKVTATYLSDGRLLIKKGKKIFHAVKPEK
ncbi:MAG: tyrosine--tRNA ligase [Negativicutes bacterium]|nr:tyrosine--tRNA ligase [Negativicutes bacterium]